MHPYQANSHPVPNRYQVIDELSKIKKWMSKDIDNLAFQRFDDLNVRNLLYIQQDLAQIQREIQDAELALPEKSLPKYEALILQARSLLSSYHDAFFAYQRMKCLPETPEYILRVLQGEPIVQARYASYNEPTEIASIVSTEIASIVSTEKGVFHRYLRKMDWLARFLALRVQNSNGKTSSSTTLYFSETILWVVDLVMINCLAIALVSAPIPILFYVHSTIGRLFAVLGFVALAAPLTSMIAKNYSTYGNLPMMLAYAAILVAFLNQTPAAKS